MVAKVLEYNSFAKWLHWLIAIAIALQYFLAEWAEEAFEAGDKVQAAMLFGNHKSLGMTIFVLAIVRLVWRNVSVKPMLPAEMPAWQILAAKLNHYLFYVLLIGMPLTGWLGSSAAGYAVNWFGLLELPDLVAPNEQIREMYHSWHEAMWIALQALLALHVLAALKHSIYDGDSVLRSMWSGTAIIFAALFLVAGWFGVQEVNRYLEETKEARLAAGITSIDEVVLQSDLPAWRIDHSNSSVKFRFERAGEVIDTDASDWQASIHFDPEQLQQSAIEFAVQSTAEFAGIHFRANQIDERDGLYTAQGFLELDGAVVPQALNFKVAARRGAGAKVLVGSTRIDRTSQGEVELQLTLVAIE